MKDNRRYYSLDALRGSMMMLGVLIHSSQWYVSRPFSLGGLEVVTDPSTYYLFDYIVLFIHSFRMPLFFILAGFFCSLLVEKRGIKETYINRGKRVLGPLLAGCITIVPLSLFLGLAFIVSVRSNTHQLIPDAQQLNMVRQNIAAADVPAAPPLLHLWFLYYLLYFYLTIPLCVAIVRCLSPVQWKVDNWLASPAMIVVFGLYTSLTLWPYKAGIVLEGFIFITPHLPSLIYYGSFFIIGYIFHNHRGILNTCKEKLPWFGLLSLILLPLATLLSNAELAMENPTVLQHLTTVLVNSFCTWALIYTFLGIFLRYLDYDAPWILYISQSSYWVYIFHLPVATFAAWFMLKYEVHALVKFTFVITFTTLACFITYHYLVQRTWVSIFLNGKRFYLPWPWQRQHL